MPVDLLCARLCWIDLSSLSALRRPSTDCDRFASQSSLPDLWPATPDLGEGHGLLGPAVPASAWPNPALQLEPAASGGPALASPAFTGGWLDAAPAQGGTCGGVATTAMQAQSCWANTCPLRRYLRPAATAGLHV